MSECDCIGEEIVRMKYLGRLEIFICSALADDGVIGGCEFKQNIQFYKSNNDNSTIMVLAVVNDTL